MDINTLDADCLRLALAIQAFLPVDGWRRWDTGGVGYTAPISEDEDTPFITLDQGRYREWSWRVCAANSKTLEEGDGYVLGIEAMRDAVAAFKRQYPGVVLPG